MGYYFNRGWAPGADIETIAGVPDLGDMAVLKTLFNIDYEADGTIAITIKNVYKIVNGMFELVGVKIEPEDALECLMVFNEDVRDGQL